MELSEIISTLRKAGRLIVFTNGCFDIIHAGHVEMFRAIKRECGESSFVIVGLNSDESVRGLKGDSRPINGERDRAAVLLGLKGVDYVVAFNSLRVDSLLREIKPDVWCKGGGYTLKTLDASERLAAKEVGARIHLLPMTEGKSTTATIARLTRPVRHDKSKA